MRPRKVYNRSRQRSNHPYRSLAKRDSNRLTLIYTCQSDKKIDHPTLYQYSTAYTDRKRPNDPHQSKYDIIILYTRFYAHIFAKYPKGGNCHYLHRDRQGQHRQDCQWFSAVQNYRIFELYYHLQRNCPD